MLAICFKCGAKKPGAVSVCEGCGAVPRSNSELAASLALSTYVSPADQLLTYARDISSGKSPSLPREALTQALEALKDPQLRAMLHEQGAPTNPSPDLSTKKSQPYSDASQDSGREQPVDISPSDHGNREAPLTSTALHRSAFALLGATVRDNRRKIVQLAEDKALEADHDRFQKARSDLTTPRTRIGQEIAWLPGVSPRKAVQLVQRLQNDPLGTRDEAGLPTLAHLNLLAAALEAVDGEHDPEDLAIFIQEVAYLADVLDPEDVMRDINEDRTISGFPEVRGLDQIETELADRKRYYRGAIKDALDRLPAEALVHVMTMVVDGATSSGEEHAPELIDDLVDSYEVETQGFLEKEEENIRQLISMAREHAGQGAPAVKPYIDQLEAVAQNWDKVAQPIQLSSKARGIEHEPSQKVAYQIRSLAIDLFNEHDLLFQSQRLTGMLRRLFAEVPDVSERIEEDADALADIFKERKRSQAEKAEWERDITFSAEVGLVFKDRLSISPQGVSWKGAGFPLKAITRVRWGGVRHSVNGVPSGTTFTIGFGDARSEVVLELKKEQIYSEFVGKLWRAVCVRLLGEMLETLRQGKSLQLNNAVLHDDGITLERKKIFGANEKIRCGWDEVTVWNADGSFCIGARDDKKAVVALSYIYNPNTHIVEQAIRMAFKKPGLARLSELLQ